GERTILDVMMALRLPLILVAGSYLGTISHTLTALDSLYRRDMNVLAIIVSETAGSTVPLDVTRAHPEAELRRAHSAPCSIRKASAAAERTLNARQKRCFTCAMVSNMPSRLNRACSRNVSSVEPERQRIQPRNRPAANISAIPVQSY